MQNPLFHFSGLPLFDQIRPEHVTPAISQLLDEGRALVDALRARWKTWRSASRAPGHRSRT